MLLKQSRNGQSSKFVKGTSHQRESQILRMEQVKGIYVPKESRMAKKLEIQRAHFILGTYKEMPKKSYGQDLIEKSIDKAHTNSNVILKEAAERKKMVEMSRQSNFNIGESAKIKTESYAQETSSKVAFQYKSNKNKNSTTDIQRSKDFKMANFKLGTQVPKYVTTNNDTYINNSGQKNDIKTSRINKPKQQFQIGNEGQSQFLTEVQKKYIKHDLTDMKKVYQEVQQKGLQLRQSNFQFGTDQPCYKAVNFKPQQWRSPTPKNMERAQLLLSSRENLNQSGQKSVMGKNESNFKIGQKSNVSNQFLSLNRQAAESVNTGVEKMNSKEQNQLKELKQDIRKTHFNLGNNQTSYVSHAGNTMVEHPITTDQIHKMGKNRQNQIDINRRANFKLPYTQDQKTETSTYKQCISNVVESDQLAPGRQKIMSNLKKSTFKIGTENKLNCITENSDQYGYPIVHQNLTTQNQCKNNELKNYLKGHHFEFGFAKKLKPAQTPTVEKNLISNNNDKQKQENFKNDQRASHFKMGYDSQQIRPTSYNGVSKSTKLIRYEGLGEKNKTIENGQISNFPIVNRPKTFGVGGGSGQFSNVQQMISRNRTSHIIMGQQVGSNKTSNQAFYKWIQPVQ